MVSNIKGAAAAVLVAAALVAPACGKDKPTYGGGFSSPEECIELMGASRSGMTSDELVAHCNRSSADKGPGLKTCPERLEVLAERRGGGFVQGVDPEYDPAMDWDGDGVSCE